MHSICMLANCYDHVPYSLLAAFHSAAQCVWEGAHHDEPHVRSTRGMFKCMHWPRLACRAWGAACDEGTWALEWRHMPRPQLHETDW